MSILSQLTNHNFNDICENTKLELFAEYYRAWNATVYLYDPDPEIRKACEDWAKRAEIRLQEIIYILQILGIYDELFQLYKYEIDVETALEKGITYKEAHDERIFSFTRA